MIIFDFDQTLVDTQPVEHLRARRAWREVMTAIPRLVVYDGIYDLLADLHDRDIKTAVVTKSPSMVPKAIITRHRWPIDIVVGYHDVSRQKPDPEGLLLALRKAAADPETSYHVGDQPEDTRAARAAGMVALGSAWGIPDTRALEASRPDHIFTSVRNLQKFLLG